MELTKKKSKNKMYTVADILVKILEENNVKYVFGIPGSQILPIYNSLSKSKIKHILTRHEQVAAHAADGYARTSGNFGVCISTAGPGAMNLTMGVATAFKDSIPILILTGDNSYPVDYNDFQSIKTSEVFKEITHKSFNPENSKNLIENFKEAIYLLKHGSYGPIHINLHENLLKEKVSTIETKIKEKKYKEYDFEDIIKRLEDSEKPLILAGSGVIWSKCEKILDNFVKKNNIPLVTTFHGKGVVSEFEKLNLGIVGIRGSDESNYALENADLILALGSKLSDRTLKLVDLDEFKSKLINVNLKNSSPDINTVKYDIKEFLSKIEHGNYLKDKNWINEIYSNKKDIIIDGIYDDTYPLRPPYIINKIIESNKDTFIISDAGSHTTWTLLLSKLKESKHLIFSGGFGPMGYGVGGAIGAAIANPNDKIVVINGDGDFQMNLQELSTIRENNLNIKIFILNNSKLGIIEQWERMHDMNSYQVDLNSNPDFVKLGKSYNINSYKVCRKEELENVLSIVSNDNKPAIVEVLTRMEDIPLPRN